MRLKTNRRDLALYAVIGAIITQHTSISEQEVADLFLQAQTKDANWAVDKGIIHEVRNVQVPRGSPIVSLVFQR